MKKYGLGVDGETLAAAYLESLGYRLLERNFTSRFGEIDIVSVSPDGRYLCFTEVKTRKSEKNIASGLESISAEKQRKIVKTAKYFLVKNRRLVESKGLQPRFDCIEVNVDEKVDFKFIENAFDA
ncbi:MAG: YraN family protein [Clostridia bacterium]|nr:YraN family protein [Clostridia bacterium]